MRTPQQAYEQAYSEGVIEAWLLGKKIEVGQHFNGFLEYSPYTGTIPNWCDPTMFWRVAPEVKRRRWTAKDVPPGAIYRRKGWPEGVWSSIVAVGDDYFTVLEHDAEPLYVYFHEAFVSEADFYSVDGGKTWAHCSVEERS